MIGDPCQKIETLLYETEEDLNTEELCRLEKHLESCPECREERELFLDSWSALNEEDDFLEPGSMIRAKVWEQIRKEEEEPPQLAVKHRDLKPLISSLQKLAVAGIAVTLGFGLGRGLRPAPLPTAADRPVVATEAQQQEFLDKDLIELASQEGYSVEIFPERTDFTPLDQDMMSALAPDEKVRSWVKKDRGSVVPVQYISQGGPTP